MQPGDTITPGGQPPTPQNTPTPQPESEAQNVPVPPQPESPLQAPAPQAQTPVPQAPAPTPQQPALQAPQQSTPQANDMPAPVPEAAWQFTAEEDYSGQAPAAQAAPAVSWTASEYVAHDKNIGWYLLVVLASLALAAGIYFITRDYISPVAVAVLGISFAAFGARKPRVLEYAIDNTGVHIGQRSYAYGMFRTFSIIEEDATRSILLMPLQRFNLPISIYYDPAEEDEIINALAAYLPHEDRQPGAVDNFMRKIRF